MIYKPEISRAFVLEAAEGLPLGFAVLDAEQRLVWCNEAFAAFQDERPARLIGETALNLVMKALPRFRAPSVDRTQWKAWTDAYWSQISRRRPQPLEVEASDGRWFLFAAEPLPSGGIAVVRTDITLQKRAETRYRDIAQGSSDWTWEMDAELRFTFIDPRAAEMSGNDPKRAIGKRRDEVGDVAADPEGWTRHLDDLANRRSFRDFVYCVTPGANGTRIYRSSGQPIFGADGGFHGYRGTAADITEQIAVERALRDSEALKAAMIDTALDAIIVVDDHGNVAAFNPAAERMLGVSRADALGKPVNVVAISARLLESAADEPGRRIEDTAVRSDGSLFPVEIAVSRVTLDGYMVTIAFIRDITDQKEFERKLEALAYFDPLTGIANRTLMLERLDKAAIDHRDLALLYLALDRFEIVRSSVGHDVADRALAALAQRLVKDLPHAELVARLGAVEFGLVVADAADPLVDDVVAQVQTSLARPIAVEGREVVLAGSIGIVRSGRQYKAGLEMLRDAAVAADHARAVRASGHARFLEPMRARAVEAQRIESDLRRALESDDQLRLSYQPIVHLDDGKLAGFEALARWRHPERGLVPAADFIEVAEQTGLVIPLGLTVLERACLELAAWPKTSALGVPFFVSVNLSARQLGHPDLVSDVGRIIRSTGADPTRIKLEITESAVMADAGAAVEILRRLKDLGVRIAVDDFGTGYSSLSYLTQLPVDSLKIDQSFIAAIHGSVESRGVVRVVTELGRLLRLETIAEGVETAGDLEILRILACDLGQGFLFSRPLDPEAATAIITAGRVDRRKTL
jgi:Amt family ammonium transporter